MLATGRTATPPQLNKAANEAYKSSQRSVYAAMLVCKEMKEEEAQAEQQGAGGEGAADAHGAEEDSASEGSEGEGSESEEAGTDAKGSADEESCGESSDGEGEEAGGGEADAAAAGEAPYRMLSAAEVALMQRFFEKYKELRDKDQWSEEDLDKLREVHDLPTFAQVKQATQRWVKCWLVDGHVHDKPATIKGAKLEKQTPALAQVRELLLAGYQASPGAPVQAYHSLAHLEQIDKARHSNRGSEQERPPKLAGELQDVKFDELKRALGIRLRTIWEKLRAVYPKLRKYKQRIRRVRKRPQEV